MLCTIALGAVYGISGVFGFEVPVWERKWQVPAQLVNGPADRAGLVWGAILGWGTLTYAKFPAVLLMHCLILSSGSLSWGVLLGSAYGFGRSLPVLLNPPLPPGVGEPGRMSRVCALSRYKSAVKKMNGVVLTVVTVLLVMGLLET